MLEILAIVLVFIALCIYAADKYITSFVVFIAGVVLGYYAVDAFKELVTAFGWRNLIVYGIPAYFAAGGLVALAKWVFFNLTVASHIADVKREISTRIFTGPNKEAERRKAFTEKWNIHSRYGEKFPYIDTTAPKYDSADWLREQLTPRARKNVERITFWILQWPLVLIALFFSDILAKVGKHAARFFDWLFAVPSRLLIKNATKDL